MVSDVNLAAARSTGRVIEGKKGGTIDVPEGAGLFILECSDCKINAPGKSSSVTIDGCKDVFVLVGSVEAALVIKNCENIGVSLLRCHTITVENCKKIKLTCKCQPAAELEEKEAAQSPELGTGKGKLDAAADEASAIHLFTSGSEEVSISFEGLFPNGTSAVTHRVPKDSLDESGSATRSVSRITVDPSGGGSCTTVKCDKYGTPLQDIDAAAAGVAWLSDHASEAAEPSSAVKSPAEGKEEMSYMPKTFNTKTSSVAAETESVPDFLDVAEILEATRDAEEADLVRESLEMKGSSALELGRPKCRSVRMSSVEAEAGNVADVSDLAGMLDPRSPSTAPVSSSEAGPVHEAKTAGDDSKTPDAPASSG